MIRRCQQTYVRKFTFNYKLPSDSSARHFHSLEAHWNLIFFHFAVITNRQHFHSQLTLLLLRGHNSLFIQFIQPIHERNGERSFKAIAGQQQYKCCVQLLKLMIWYNHGPLQWLQLKESFDRNRQTICFLFVWTKRCLHLKLLGYHSNLVLILN